MLMPFFAGLLFKAFRTTDDATGTDISGSGDFFSDNSLKQDVSEAYVCTSFVQAHHQYF